MAQARVVVLNEATLDKPGGWILCFQYCRYEYGSKACDPENGGKSRDQENGYRFIWRRPDGSLQGARGQARIPSLADIQYLTGKALEKGWGCHREGSL